MRKTDRSWLAAAAISTICLAFAAAPAAAQTTAQGRLSGLKMSGDQPIQIESDRLEVREKENLAIFSGNVTVVQGPTLLKAGKLTVYYAKDGGGSAATGSAAIDRLQVDGTVYVKSDNQIATGEHGTFDMKTEILVLSGKEVVLTEGANILTGCKLTVDMKTGAGQCRGVRRPRQRAVHAGHATGRTRRSCGRPEPIMASGKSLLSRIAGRFGNGLARPAVRADADRLKGTLIARGLTKSYKGRKVVNGVSLGVRGGEAVGLLGPNGAGKTTCFYMVTGLIPVDKGSIEIDGFDVTQMPMYRRARLGIGYLPQEASIFRGLTVESNIRAVLEVVEKDRKERERALDALLDEFHISHLRKAPAISLSGGERRRLEISRALASKPHYMLLDEPFAGIDPIAVADIQQLVRHLTARGIGVLITDHNVRETLGLIDRAYIIHAGEVLTHGHPSEIVRNADVRRLYLGESFTL